MSQKRPQRPITNGDEFDHVQGEQKAEVLTDDQTQKGGAESATQAANDKNAENGAVDRDAHSGAAANGVEERENIIDGEVSHQQSEGEESVADGTTYDPTFPEVAVTKGITIGQALEEAALNNPDKLVDQDIAQAIICAEVRALGLPVAFRVGTTAQSAASKNENGEQIKLPEVLGDASKKMLLDKVVTQEDVEEVREVEGHNGVVTNALQAAVNSNAAANCYNDPHKNQFEIPPGLLRTLLRTHEQEEEKNGTETETGSS